MPIANAPRSRSPYTVHQGGRFVCQAPNLYALSAVLEELDTRFQALRKQEEARRSQGLRFGGLWRDLPEKPPVQVVDNRGEVRPDLSSAWRIRHYFNRKAKGAPVLEDLRWDGDIRPRGVPVEGTGHRHRYSHIFLRHPKTQRTRRLGFPLFEDGEPEFRGDRRPRALPTVWDDLPRRSRKDRSWKNFRTAQWRPKG